MQKKTIEQVSKKKIKVRGKYLSAVLFIGGVVLVYDTVEFFRRGGWYHNPTRMITLPGWYDYIYLSSLVVSMILLVNIFYWRKWAVYLSVVKEIVGFLLIVSFDQWNSIYNGSHSQVIHNITEHNVGLLVLFIILLVIYYWAIIRKWKYFE